MYDWKGDGDDLGSDGEDGDACPKTEAPRAGEEFRRLCPEVLFACLMGRFSSLLEPLPEPLREVPGVSSDDALETETREREKDPSEDDSDRLEPQPRSLLTSQMQNTMRIIKTMTLSIDTGDLLSVDALLFDKKIRDGCPDPCDESEAAEEVLHPTVVKSGSRSCSTEMPRRGELRALHPHPPLICVMDQVSSPTMSVLGVLAFGAFVNDAPVAYNTRSADLVGRLCSVHTAATPS